MATQISGMDQATFRHKESEKTFRIVGAIAVIGILLAIVTLVAHINSSNKNFHAEYTQRMTACVEAGNHPLECRMAASDSNRGSSN